VSIYFFTVGEEIFKVSPALSLVASFAAEGSFVTQATEPLELPPPLRSYTFIGGVRVRTTFGETPRLKG